MTTMTGSPNNRKATNNFLATDCNKNEYNTLKILKLNTTQIKS